MILTSCIYHKLQINACYAYNLSRDIHFERCCYPFARSLLDFYRWNFHEHQNKKWVPSLPKSGHSCNNDSVYILRSQQKGILAALRLTRSKNDATYTFLRSLCVSRDHRRQGLASRLLEESIQDFDKLHHCYCFASPNREGLFQQSGFLKISNKEMITLPKWLLLSYNSMDARWRAKNLGPLGLFIKYHPSVSAHTPQIILLQHFSEMAKDTATGWLLDDSAYSKRFPCIVDEKCNLNLQLQRWIWSGRDDASMIEEKINKLVESRTVHLLWTGSAGDETSSEDSNNPHSPPKAYIILDGTWQQAKHMFRRTPALWKLPKLSLRSNLHPSTYVLRGDYSGWKERFSNGGDSKSLLCTAEVAAAVLDRCGDSSTANIIRTRLNMFQNSFLQEKNTELIIRK
ncbi:hypothetical protein ACHAXR_004455 [Thalassiosira sp. AJA248-18]